MATKKQQTFAKMQREQRVREKRQLKAEKKQAAAEAKLAALNAPEGSETELDEGDTRSRRPTVSSRKSFTPEEARRIGAEIGIDWDTAPFDVEEFRSGMDVELEHGLHDVLTNVTDDDPR